MKTITAIYLKLFLAYGLAFGFFMSLWDYIDEGEISFLKTTFGIVFFGSFMAWASVKDMKKSKQKFGGTKLTEEDFKSSQSETITKNKSINEIYDLLKFNAEIKKWNLKIEKTIIVGKTKVSWASWGERITIKDMNDIIEIESKPVLATTLFDDGRNKANVLLIKKLIEA